MTTPARSRSSRRRWPALTGVGIAVLALAAVAYTVFAPHPGPASTGAAAPAVVTAATASGQQVTVPGGGKPSVLFFFTGGCSSCGPAAHAMAQAQQANPQAANYVAIDMDPAEPPASITAFLAANQAGDLAVTSDRGAALTTAYGVTQLSTAVVLDPSGQVVSRLAEPAADQIQAGLAQARTR